MAEQTPRTGLYDARPTLTIEGQKQEELAGSLLLSVVVEETTLGLFRCEARFRNWGKKYTDAEFLLFGGKPLDFGKSFAVEFGPQKIASTLFSGRIMALEAHYPQSQPPELVVLAEDRFQDLRMERRTRSFSDLTDADVFRKIAGKHGLSAQVDVDGPSHRALAQVNQSDLAFLRERAAAIDAQLWVDGSTLHVQARSRRKSSEVTLVYQSNLLEFSVLADLAHQRTSVTVCGWDVGGKEGIEESADSGVLGAELGNLRGGSAILGRALAPRIERLASATPLSKSEAQEQAKTCYREHARRFVSGSGVASGEPKLRVGTEVTLEGLGRAFSGKYFVTRARHTYDQSVGYRTDFDVERAGLGEG